VSHRIPEIELNFSNACTANCFICAKAHGRGNVPLMLAKVFEAVVEQLHDVDFDLIQTSGNGDCFLHPQFTHCLQELRSQFSSAKLVNYSNFALYSPEMADWILGGKLLDEQFTRIDSLDAKIFERSTGISRDLVLGNLEYWIRHNETVKLTIGYSSVPEYYRKCREVLGKPPFHGPFSEAEVAAMPDEYEMVRTYFGAIPTEREIAFYRINQSLWAEREDPRTPADPSSPCPKERGGILGRVAWICPNGDMSVCGYDDQQDTFIAGNVLQEHLLDIWNGEKRREWLEGIRQRRHKAYPCNPRCCKLYGDHDV
jgi:hypothetical protein